MATGSNDIFSINILTKTNESTGNENSNKTWLLIRGFLSALVHVVYYVAAALLISSLIWDGINIVKNTLTPEQRKGYKERIEHFFKSVFLLVGTLVIMGMNIYLSGSLCNMVNVNNSSELPIRVKVESGNDDNTYEFSTNFTGCIRFMSEIDNPADVDMMFEYVLTYFFMVIINAALTIVMFLRVILSAILAIIGVFIAVKYAFSKETDGPKRAYISWIVAYTINANYIIIFGMISTVLLRCIGGLITIQ